MVKVCLNIYCDFSKCKGWVSTYAPYRQGEVDLSMAELPYGWSSKKVPGSWSGQETTCFFCPSHTLETISD